MSTPDDPLAPLAEHRRAVATATVTYRKHREAARTAMGHLLRVWPEFPRTRLRNEAGGGRRFHFELMSGHRAAGGEEIPLWQASEAEREHAYAQARAAIADCLEAKARKDQAARDRQNAVLAARERTRDTMPLRALVNPSGLSYQWLLKLDHRPTTAGGTR